MNDELSKESVSPIRITTVRYLEKDAWDHLAIYVFGGYRAGPRVPRGIAPDLVSRFVVEEIRPDSPVDAFKKIVHVLRFYETEDCLPHLEKMLTRDEEDFEAIARSAYVLQAMADVGQENLKSAAAEYFDTWLSGHPKAFEAAEVLLETFVVLSPEASLDKLSAAIAKEVEARKVNENRDEQGMREYHEALAIQRMKLPNALFTAQAKKKVLSMKGEELLAELFNIYMGQSNISDDLMMTWAGRMIRKIAMNQDPEPVYEIFKREILKADPEKLGKDPLTDTLVSRSAQAVLYLQGKLTRQQRDLYDKTKLGAMNFLWDDLNP